jgi:hypothetical protein
MPQNSIRAATDDQLIGRGLHHGGEVPAQGGERPPSQQEAEPSDDGAWYEDRHTLEHRFWCEGLGKRQHQDAREEDQPERGFASEVRARGTATPLERLRELTPRNSATLMSNTSTARRRWRTVWPLTKPPP